MRQLLVVLLLCQVNPILSQSVIINEMSQGSSGGKEWVELLVVDQGVDLRAWELGDNDDGIWHSIAEFTDHHQWSSVERGTIIVIYNDGDVDGQITAAGAADTSFADKSVIIPIGYGSFFIDTGPWGSSTGAFANSDADDAAALRDANDVMIHDLAASHPTAAIPAPSGSKAITYTSNTVDGIANPSNWLEIPSTSATPGAGNGGENSNWIDSSLPVELSAWTATVVDGGILLQWSTESETENQGFIINRAEEDGFLPHKIASFISDERLRGFGSTTQRHDYEYLDTDVVVGQTYTYQLMDVDFQNRIQLHPEIGIAYTLESSNGLRVFNIDSIYPNPGNPGVTIALSSTRVDGSCQLGIYDLRGALIKSMDTADFTVGQNLIFWNGSDSYGNKVESGIYFIRLVSPNQIQHRSITLIR